MAYCTWCHRDKLLDEDMAESMMCLDCKPAVDAIDILLDGTPKLLDACRLLLSHSWMRKEINQSWRYQLRQLRRSLLEYIDAGEDI